MRRLAALVLVACTSKPVPSNAPPPAACTVDADCTVLMVGPDPKNACCDVTLTAAPLAKAHVTFVLDWRKKHCDAKPSCPPLALPGHPPACAYEPKCVAGTCRNGC
jgi:hypothetical protein